MTRPIRIAVVTGGGHGIGRAICHRLGRDDVRVAVADLDSEAATTVASEVNGIAYRVDVSDEGGLQDLIKATERELGPIDLFVSNAGVGYGDAEGNAASQQGGMFPVNDRWERCWNINVMAHVYAARSMIPRMTGRGGGCLVNVVSAAGLLIQIGEAVSFARKECTFYHNQFRQQDKPAK